MVRRKLAAAILIGFALFAGTAISAAAWVPHSTPHRRWAPIRCPIAAPGSASATRALAVLVEGDPRLLNRYDVILLDPKRHPAAKQIPARRFAHWLASAEGQAAIGAYELNGEQLFHPSAAAPR